MKPAFNDQRVHGSAERSAFSWAFDEFLCAPSGHYQHVTIEHLQDKALAIPDASRALNNLLKVQSRRRVRVAFYIPYKFKREYKMRFQALAPKEKFWAEDYRFCGQVMSLVPLPSSLGHTALRDDELI